MKALKTLTGKPNSKQDRKHQVLMGAIDYYIKTGKAVGSDTLRSERFDLLSSATIRNYFSHLESEGFLTQAHTSGGRIPTQKGFKLYAEESLKSLPSSLEMRKDFNEIANEETKEIVNFLHTAANQLSQISNTPIFLSAPRFDQDYVLDIKLVPIDHLRYLAVIITDFGAVQTEILHAHKKLNSFSTKRLESYFNFRLTGRNNLENLDADEEEIALKFYNELMVRYIVGYTNYTDKEIIRTGFSKLLTYPDFQDTNLLANSLSLFENVHSMRLILKECSKQNRLRFWLGDDLSPYTKETMDCAVIAAPYYINQQSVGAIGLIGPTRIAYRELFELLTEFSEAISRALTRNIYKHKISFRQPSHESLNVQKTENRLIGHSNFMLLENQM